MTNQAEHTGTNWDRAYLNSRTPWLVTGFNEVRDRLLAKYAPGKALLDVGCGTGENAAALRGSGYDVTGIDISSVAVEIARSKPSISDTKLVIADFFSYSDDFLFDVVHDHGTFHNLQGADERDTFVHQVSRNLDAGGIWLNISACADTPKTRLSHGGIYLQDVVCSAEPYFEVLEIVRDPYGLSREQDDFLAWYSVFRRR